MGKVAYFLNTVTNTYMGQVPVLLFLDSPLKPGNDEGEKATVPCALCRKPCAVSICTPIHPVESASPAPAASIQQRRG